MATVSTNIRIDNKIKKQSVALLEGLGLTLSDAVNMFLHQIVLNNGLPFEVKYPDFKPEVYAAMEEAVKISRDSSVKAYTDTEMLFQDLDS